jgi:hypothetical protein
MKTVLPVFTAALALLMSTGLDAGEITVYKDKDGVINLTDRPVPADARIQQVIHYKEKSAAELAEQQTAEAQRRQATKNQKEALQIRELKANAARTGAEAEKESALAREKIKAAEAYLERYKQKRRNQRRRHHQTAKRVAQEAEEAHTRANAAITRANQAQEEVRKASVGPTSQAPAGRAGQASGIQMGKEK